MPCVTGNVESPKVSVFKKYAIEVESIPPSQRKNRDVHHHYLNRLRDTLDTLRKIVEKARSKRPSDHSLDYACVYTKRSQELLENVSASCPKARNKRDKVIATTPLTRKKHVTFADPLETSGNNTTNHVKHPTVQKTNVPIIHSTGVSNATKARRSQSKSNKMNDKTLPANSVPEKKVEDHHRKNKSKLSKKNQKLIFESKNSTLPRKICLGIDLEPDEWIKDSGCSKHMTGNRKLFSNLQGYKWILLWEIKKKNLENAVEDETLEIDDIVNIKESRNHPLENVIGKLNQLNPRLVAQGYNQQEGIDYDETYAPVARLESIRILLAYACALDFKLFQMDVKGAFLNDFINEDRYMWPTTVDS
ncbi:retrovirus-related pol polyprotein from transposon TNT 1-94 [Tanacetum coccineum]